jgi:hypothetical protein
VEVSGCRWELGGKAVAVDIRVAPAQEIAPDYLLVVFACASRRRASDAGAAGSRAAVAHLERELEQMKTRLRETIEQYESPAKS